MRITATARSSVKLLAGLAVFLVLAVASACANGGTLSKPQLEAMFPPPMLVGDKLVHLPVWPVFSRNSQPPVLSYFVFETVDLEAVAGYSGKPINLLVVMDPEGAFVQTQLLDHTEPIFRSAEGNALLGRFAAQYPGPRGASPVTVNHQVQILGAKAQRQVTPTNATLHGIVAGTVTARAMDRSLMEAAAQVAQAHANPEAAEAASAAVRGADDRYQRNGFSALAGAKLIQPVAVFQRDIEAAFRAGPGSTGIVRDAENLIRPRAKGLDLWVALPGIPQAGRNLLTPPRWREVRDLREAGTPVLLVLDGGRYALRDPAAADNGAAAPRGATLVLRQGGREHRLQALPWSAGLKVSGQSSGVAADSQVRWYAVQPAADGAGLDILAPLTIDLSLWRRTRAGADEVSRVVIERTFETPDVAAWAAEHETPRWLASWSGRMADLAILGAGLALLVPALVLQRRTAASAKQLVALRTAWLVFTLVFIGWYAQGQLTIVSLTSLIEALVAGRSTGFLLLDPMAVVLWGVTGVTLLVWGRGTFCGWLCPFGALQELVARVAGLFGIAQKRLRVALDRRLKRVKYVALALLCGAAATSPAWTERLVEVEPFKTAISLHFQRDWPYVAFALGCVALGVLVYRGYCRYVCPLGAALALLGRLRLWRWIPRRAECGTPCQTCRHRCGYQAIEPSGKIDYAECFQCLDCVQLHDDRARCLPLVRQHKGKPVIPIRPVPATARGATA